ncbi:MAG: glycosyltransferase [Thermoanaerobaculia bacterium]
MTRSIGVHSILFISQQIPWPKSSGGNIRSYHVLEALGASFDVTLVASADTKALAEEGRAALAGFCKTIEILPDPKTSSGAAKARSFLASLASGVPAFVHHNYNRSMADSVRRLAGSGQFDLIHLNHLDTVPYVESVSGSPYVIDTHNILHDYYARRSAQATNPVAKSAFAIEARRLRRYELRALRGARLILTCSREEQEMLLALDPELRVEVVPNGVDSRYFAPVVSDAFENPPDLVFLGDMAYPPNHDAAVGFVRSVFPELVRRDKQVRLIVVGKSPQRELLALAAGRSDLLVTGFVDDVREYLGRARVFLVPVRYGSGTRLKILSAFSMGIPTVSTTLGAEGIRCRDGHDISIADEPAAMAEAVHRLLTDAELHRRISKNCRETAIQHYDWTRIGQQLRSVYDGIEVSGEDDPRRSERPDNRPVVLHTRVVTGAGGGPEKTILNSPRFLGPAGYRTLCAYMRHPDDPGFQQIERRARLLGAELLTVDDRGPLDWQVLGRLRGICELYRPAIWHGHEYKSNLLGIALRRSHPMRLVTTVHGWVQQTWKTPLYYAIDRLCLRSYDGVICVSRDIHQTCLRLGIPSDKCWLVPNAIDLEEVVRREPTAAAKERLRVEPGRLIVGAAGRLSAEKGFSELIRAAGLLVDQGVDLELWIAGDGPQRSELERLVSALGLGQRIKLLGYRADLVDLYHAMDVFVVSSIREGLPNVLLEAMALELPVLCTSVAGIPDLIRDGENGLLVGGGSARELAEGLRPLLENPSLRQRVGHAARKSVAESHDLRRRMEVVSAIYEKVLRSGESAQPRS